MPGKGILILFWIAWFANRSDAQEIISDSEWTLEMCINHALEKNIQVRKSFLTNESNLVDIKSAKGERLPSLDLSVRQNQSLSNQEDAISGETGFTGNSSTNYSVSSMVTVFNGFSISNRIRQAELDFESGRYNSETIKESIALNVLDAFLEVLYAEEQVKNTGKQIEATEEQLFLAEQRLSLRTISRSDYLQVKSQLASEKLNLANAKSQLTISKVNLMQLMELQITDNFAIAHPRLDSFLNQQLEPDVPEVYNIALDIKPQIKNAALNKESAMLDEKVNPLLGLILSLPILHRNQVKTDVLKARISYQNAQLNEIDVKNQLRKDIEQACVNITDAQTEYEASLEQYYSTYESYNLAAEKFRQGLINSVDYLFEKANLIAAESQLLQAKYNLIFRYKVLDFYTGIALTL